MLFLILSQISQISQIFFCSSSAGLLASRAADLADKTVEEFRVISDICER